MKSFRIFSVFCVLFSAFFVPPCVSFAAGASQPVAPCDYETLSIPAPSLAGNRVGEPGVQSVYVYLPPSYKSGVARYPVLYYFAGYHESSDIASLRKGVDLLMRRKEFIVVSINDVNVLQGSFGANSPVTGNWRDFFLKDAIPYIDSHYRTIPTAEGRIAGGFSMGGHIALRLAFEHPDVFSALYAVSPGVFDKQGLEHAMKTWDDEFLVAYGAAYAPNTDKPYPFADYPKMSGTDEDLAIRARWNKGFGDLEGLLDAYLAQPVRLKSIAIEVGSNDDYPWIPEGCEYFSGLLRRKGIVHRLIVTEHRHEFNAEIFHSGMGLFTAKYFSETQDK
jgi:dienelactone hydrolase